jgi:hypothetical protein
MSEEKNGPVDLFDPTGMLKHMRDVSLDQWSKTMSEFVHSEVYGEATAKMLDTWLSTSGPFRKALESAMAQSLANLSMPSRNDVLRLAEQLTHIEMRLDDMEAKLDQMLQARAQGNS